MEIRIAPSRKEELDKYYEIFDDSALYDHYFDGTDILHEWIDDYVGEDKGEVFIAYNSEEEPVGLIHFTVEGMCGYPHVFLLGVKKQYRGMGVGRKLLEFFFSIAEGINAPNMYIMTSTFNVRTFRLYQKMGFKKIGIIPSFILSDVNEYIMVRHNPKYKCPYGGRKRRHIKRTGL